MQLGFVGLGKMGSNMVTRLTRGGHAVVAWDRSPDAVERVRVEGAIGVDSPSHLHHHIPGFVDDGQLQLHLCSGGRA